jgi:large subunit ribosomal protein L17
MTMSSYTIGEIGVWLLLAASLGFVLGWLVRELVLRARQGVAAPPALVAAEPKPATEPQPAAEPEPAEPSPETETETETEPELEPVPGPHPGSALPLADGSAPSDAHVVKVSRGSKIYHAPSSPAFARTTAAFWFTSAEDAEAAGFRRPKNG